MVARRRRSRRSRSGLAKPQATPQKEVPQTEVERHFSSFEVAAFHQGPLPPPEVLHAYEQLVNDGAERTFRQMELNAAQRRKNENRKSRSEEWTRIIAPSFGFVIIMTALIGGFYLIKNGHNAEGISSVIGSLAVLAGVYFGGALDVTPAT